MTNIVKIYCGCCANCVSIVIEPTGNIVCPKCHFVISTLTADEPSEYDIVKKLRPIIEEGIDDG